MQYLVQPRGPGTCWVFRMVTPLELVGKPNPWTGKPFGREIKKGLKTRRLPDARKLRDIALGEIRKLTATPESIGNFSIEAGAQWNELFAEAQRDRDNPDRLRGLEMVYNDLADEAARPDIPAKQYRAFHRAATGQGFLLKKAAKQYKEERQPGNQRGYKPLAHTTALNLDTAVKHLKAFLGDDDEYACLEDISKDKGHRFRDRYLPEVKTGRGCGTMSAKTIEKNITLLKGLWAWAIERKLIGQKHRKNPWEFERSIPRSRKTDTATQEDYKPDEAAKLLAATKRGTREGDLIRLAFATGCRADELAALPASAVKFDGSSFHIGSGKTVNAVRFLPVVGMAKELLKARYDSHKASGRLLPEWPLRPKVDKCYAASQWFTRFRREVLGKETDGRLALHSTRHTWRTAARRARRARVAEADINQLGGWDGVRSSNSVYDHGLLEDQLTVAQQLIWDEMVKAGYLNGF